MFRRGDPPRRVEPSNNAVDTRPASSTLIPVCLSRQEFSLERRILWSDVWPELASFAFHSGIDLAFTDPLTDAHELDAPTVERILTLAAQPSTILLLLIGDRYGACDLPSALRKEEFEAIQAAVFENNVDVKYLSEYYQPDRSRKIEEYQLKQPIDSSVREKLLALVQKGAETAFEEGSINQISEHRQKRFSASLLETLLSNARNLSTPAIYVLRQFEQATRDDSNAAYLEMNEQTAKRIAELKNQLSADMDRNAVLPFSLPVEGGDIGAFLAGREADRYRDTFSRQVLERVKASLLLAHPTVRPGPPPSLPAISAIENSSHIAFLTERTARTWHPRKAVEPKITELMNGNSGVFLIQGPELSGKTQALCQLYERVPENAYKVIRFASLTYSSTLAHEMWRTLCFTVCAETGQDSTALQGVFQLADTIAFLIALCEKLDKPLYIFVDDIHTLKHGRLLSQLERRARAAPLNLHLFMTASNTAAIPPMFNVSLTVNIDALTEGEIIEVCKKRVEQRCRQLEQEQWTAVKQQLVGASKTVVNGLALVDEILLRGNVVMKGGVEGRLERIEGEYGAGPVQCLCRYLCVSLKGLTRLELSDLLSTNKALMTQIGNPPAFPPLLIDDILAALGDLVSLVLIDQRVIYAFTHAYVLNIVRHRYLSSTTDLRSAHADLADLFGELLNEAEASTPRSDISYIVFPQLLKRENGMPNTRKLRNLWFHLLHTGNMDALKEMALCQFDYLDCVVRNHGMAHLLTMYEECVMQVLHHDIEVLCVQVLLPSLETVVRDNEQLAAEVIGRLRYTRAENSHFLNTMVEQAMAWVDTYNRHPLLVPLTCWISPPEMNAVMNFTLKDWKSTTTVLAPTANHQHVLISGNTQAPGLIYMYHIASQYLITTFKGHTAQVTSISASNNGQFFISTSVDKSVRMWSFQNGECTRVMNHHTNKVICSVISSNDDFFITGSMDSTAKMISVETGEVIHSFHEHTGAVTSLALTSNNEFLMTGSGDFVVQLWNILKPTKPSEKMGSLMAPVTCIAMTSNDAFVAVACEDETLRVFGVVRYQELHELSGHEGKVNSLVCANDDCQLFAATMSKIYCYDIHTQEILNVLDCAAPTPVTSLKITSDNYFLISGCGPLVHVWNIRERNHDLELMNTATNAEDNEEGHVSAIAMSPDEKIAACGTVHGVVALWDLDICQCITTAVQVRGVSISALAFTLDSLCLLSANTDGNIVVLDTQHGQILRTVNFHNAEVVSMCCLETGRVVTCDKNQNLRMWDVLSEEDPEDLVAQGVVPPIFVPPAGRILIGHYPKNNKEMKVWSMLETGLQVKNKVYHNEAITCFAATAAGSLLVTGSTDQSLKIWQVDSGFLTQVLVGHEDSVTCCALAEDERVVVSGSRDSRLIIWNVLTGDIAQSIAVSAPVAAVAVTADSSVAFSADSAGWMEAWSSDSNKPLSSFNAHRPVIAICRSFDANRLLVQLSNCAQLPILCLHNSPAGAPVKSERRRSARAHSVTSIGSQSGTSDKKETNNGALHPPSTSAGRPGGPRATFDKMERSKSRTSLVEKDRPTNVGTVATVQQKSSFCSIL